TQNPTGAPVGFWRLRRRARGAKPHRRTLQDPEALKPAPHGTTARNDSGKRQRSRKNTAHDTSWRISVAYTANNASALSTAARIRKGRRMPRQSARNAACYSCRSPGTVSHTPARQGFNTVINYDLFARYAKQCVV
ncbi:hypothetical protein, partial [Paraburkholderia ribeironis]|uniref:hypothetical protein n=1 Tax=Paraburkholderia ribeironis TaxID=1247936 RepID=UPI001C3F5C7F